MSYRRGHGRGGSRANNRPNISDRGIEKSKNTAVDTQNTEKSITDTLMELNMTRGQKNRSASPEIENSPKGKSTVGFRGKGRSAVTQVQ